MLEVVGSRRCQNWQRKNAGLVAMGQLALLLFTSENWPGTSQYLRSSSYKVGNSGLSRTPSINYVIIINEHRSPASQKGVYLGSVEPRL